MRLAGSPTLPIPLTELAKPWRYNRGTHNDHHVARRALQKTGRCQYLASSRSQVNGAKVRITGGLGLIGSTLARRLAA
jgi:hypothetical protein